MPRGLHSHAHHRYQIVSSCPELQTFVMPAQGVDNFHHFDVKHTRVHQKLQDESESSEKRKLQ